MRTSLRRRRRRCRAALAPPEVVALAPGEVGPLLEVFAAMSSRARMLRFGTPTPWLSPAMLRRLSDVRLGTHEAYAARRGGRAVGVVRWHRLDVDPAVADLAVEVADSSQGAGIGRQLLAHAAGQAAAHGIHTFQVDVHPGNHVALSWVGRLGARPSPDDSDRATFPVAALLARTRQPKVA